METGCSVWAVIGLAIGWLIARHRQRRTLENVLKRMRAIAGSGGGGMATPDSYAALVAALDAETTRIGLKVQEYLDTIAAGGMSAAEEDAAQAGLQAVADRLKAIGSDPAEPIPPVEPEAPPA
jgi:hypothetical protein